MSAVFSEPLSVFQSVLTCVALVVQMQEMKCKFGIFSSHTFSSGTHGFASNELQKQYLCS